MIHDVDETLRRLLMGELPRVNPLWQQAPVFVTFAAPAEAEAETKPHVNLYLHDVRENTALRSDESLLRRRPGPGAGPGAASGEKEGDEDRLVGLQRPPVRLNLSYVLTAYANGKPGDGGGSGDETWHREHELLSDVLRILLRFRAVPTRYLAGSLAAADGTPESEVYGLPIAVAQPDSDLSNDPSSLWRALGGRPRPTLGLVALATMRPFETRWVQRVREIVLGFAPGIPKNGEPFRPQDIGGIRVSVAGVVVGGAGGDTPLEDARITLLDAPGTTARTDARGFWSLLDLPPGPCRARVEKPGYSTREITFDAPPVGRPDLVSLLATALPAASAAEREQQGGSAAASSAALVEVDRSRSVTLSGVLRYPDGRPAAFVPVRAGRQRRTLTDATGFYGFYDLPTGAEAEWSNLVAEVPGTGEVALAPVGAVLPATDSKKKGDAKERETETVPLPGTAAVSNAAARTPV